MSWNTKAGYPASALRTVQVKATDWQRARWEAEGKRLGVSRGAFVAWGGHGDRPPRGVQQSH